MKLRTTFVLIIFVILTWLTIVGGAAASAPMLAPTPQPPPGGHVATPAELQQAQNDWLHSRHANTFDNGQGANTTCARCKSPTNWDPKAPAAEQALDCGACKRTPGAPRPDLEGGVPIAQSDWKNIGCAVCHQPVGNSYLTSISFWNQEQGKYEPVANTTALCDKCHEGQHGFEVIEEQTASPAHKGWECTRCHGAHGTPSACTNCHNPAVGKGAAEHTQHQDVNCTACHDAGGLSIWHDQDPSSRHANEYAPVRFAHALRSWTSHNLQLTVWCGRCHHLKPDNSAPVASQVSCEKCHADGYVMFWCRYFPQDASPLLPPALTP